MVQVWIQLLGLSKARIEIVTEYPYFGSVACMEVSSGHLLLDADRLFTLRTPNTVCIAGGNTFDIIDDIPRYNKDIPRVLGASECLAEKVHVARLAHSFLDSRVEETKLPQSNR